MNILVIGGTRFFGIHMVNELLTAGYDVTIATRGKASDSFGDKVKRIFLERTKIVGFFTMRRPRESFEELRFGFVIVDPEKCGRGYGKNMLKLGLKYAKEIFGADKVSLGVFENNAPAYYCYKAIGFEDVPQNEIEKYTVMGEEWNCLELEIKL